MCYRSEITLRERVQQIGVIRLAASSLIGAATAFAMPWMFYIMVETCK